MGVSLNKGQSVSLAKKNNAYSNVSINLKWDKPEVKKGMFGSLFGGGDKNIDLDLGCLYELKDGTKSCVQALGNLFGSLDGAPFMQLDADDRSGNSNAGETMVVNGAQWDKISRVLVYSFIYEGVANWSQANGVVRLTSDVEQIEIALDNATNGKQMCAIALIENINGEMKVTKVNEYFGGHEQMDRAFNWNLNWQAGSK